MGKGRWLLALAALLAATTALSCYQWFETTYMDSIKQEVLAEIDLIQELVVIGEYTYDEVVDRCALHTGNRVTLLNIDGSLLADSAREQITFSSYLYDKEILMAREGQVGMSTLRSPITGNNTLNMTRPGRGPLGQEIIIRVAYDLTVFEQVTQAARYFSLLMVALCALGMLYVFQEYLRGHQPAARTIRRYASAISSGQRIQWRESGPAQEEFLHLADTINEMLDRNNEAIRVTDQKYSHINTILGSMDSGLLVVNTQNEVVLFNQRAEELMELDKRAFFDFIDNHNPNDPTREIIEATARVLDGGEDEVITLTLSNELILEVQVTPITNKYIPYDDFGALAMIKDVTKIKKLEALRSEFVANVSHELRTPLTLIGGFVENLRRGDLDEEDQRRAMEIISIETKRLTGLISQLLTLSKIENNLMPTEETQEVDLLSEVRSAVAAISNLAQTKSITMELDAPDTLPTVVGNAAGMRQVVMNLCENAIKYTPEGGRIVVRLWSDAESVSVSVKDNGVGIPQEDLPRIFERFYRVDKSRNSQVGGTGLGLSIVKHMVSEMGGEIHAESQEGKGSEFIGVFPLPRQKSS